MAGRASVSLEWVKASEIAIAGQVAAANRRSHKAASCLVDWIDAE